MEPPVAPGAVEGRALLASPPFATSRDPSPGLPVEMSWSPYAATRAGTFAGRGLADGL